MDEKEFNEAWERLFPDTLSLAYLFKDYFPERRISISYFQDSKRFASNDEEKKQIIDLLLKISEYLFADQDFFILISSYNPDAGFPSDYETFINTKEYQCLKSLALHEIEPDAHQGEVFLRRAFKINNIESNDLKTLFLKAAEYEIVNLMLLSFERKCLLAPYDGAFDIILSSELEKEQFFEKIKPLISN